MNLQLTTAVRTVQRRQKIHWFAERPTNQTIRKRPLLGTRFWPLWQDLHNGQYEKTAVMTSSAEVLVGKPRRHSRSSVQMPASIAIILRERSGQARMTLADSRRTCSPLRCLTSEGSDAADDSIAKLALLAARRNARHVEPRL